MRPACGRASARVELLTPLDIEQQFRIHGGHWHHGELAFDQFFMVRPVPGAAQYRTPMAGLFLCGAGAHPGGGVMGLAGRNCARQILAEAPPHERRLATHAAGAALPAAAAAHAVPCSEHAS